MQMYNTIDKFFTPTTGSAKRPRSTLTPDSAEKNRPVMGSENDKVGDLTNGQLMNALSTLLDTKLASLAKKEDLVFLTEQVTLLSEENKQLKQEISELKSSQNQIQNKLLDLECRSRRNNLIFRGIKWNERTRDFTHLIRQFCKDKLGSDDRLWINRAHPLGRDRDSIIAHLPNDSDIDYILSKARDLKGTGFFIHRDFPQVVREKRACLAAVRTEVERVAGSRRMPIAFDHLTIERCRFTWEEGKLRTGNQDGSQKLSSLFNHDFSHFLEGLSQRPAGRRNLPNETDNENTAPPVTYAAITATTSTSETQAADMAPASQPTTPK